MQAHLPYLQDPQNLSTKPMEPQVHASRRQATFSTSLASLAKTANCSEKLDLFSLSIKNTALSASLSKRSP